MISLHYCKVSYCIANYAKYKNVYSTGREEGLNAV